MAPAQHAPSQRHKAQAFLSLLPAGTGLSTGSDDPPGQENQAMTCPQLGAAVGQCLAATAHCAGVWELLCSTSPCSCVGARSSGQALPNCCWGQTGPGGASKLMVTVRVLQAERFQQLFPFGKTPTKGVLKHIYLGFNTSWRHSFARNQKTEQACHHFPPVTVRVFCQVLRFSLISSSTPEQLHEIAEITLLKAGGKCLSLGLSWQ